MVRRSLPHWLLLLLLTAVTLALTAVYLQHLLAFTGGRLGVPLDDAWIHFQFARNLAQGHGFSFNPGQPQPGSTAPLWTLLLAGAGLFTEEFLIPALALSLLFLLLTVGLSYGFTMQLTGRRWAGFLAAVGVAMAGRLLWAGLSGMEATAFAALSLAAVWLYTRQGLRPWPALLFALGSQIRPEGHALFALALADAGYEWLKQGRQESGMSWGTAVKTFAPSLLIYLFICLPYAAFSLSITGKPLPNTFYAKVGSEHFFSLRTLRETMALHWGDNPVSLILLLWGLLPTWRRSRLAVLWLLGLWLLLPLIVDQVWHHGRYTMPLIPFQMIVAAVGAHRLHRKSEVRLPAAVSRWLPAGFLLLFIMGGMWRFSYWRGMLAANANEILEIDVALGEWLAQNTPPGAVIAVDDIGAITFLSGRRIVDMNGLVSPDVWPAVRQPVGLARDSRLTRILSQTQPDYVVAFPLWHYELTRNTAVLTPIHRVETGTHTIIFQPEAQIYAARWPYVAASPAHSLDAVLGESIRLRGYDTAVTDTAVALTLTWTSERPVMEDYDVFVHILDQQGEIVAQADQQPLQGLAPTSLWQPGDAIRHPLTIPLPADLPSAEYRLHTGMYTRETGARLPATGKDTAGDTILLPPFTRR